MTYIPCKTKKYYPIPKQRWVYQISSNFTFPIKFEKKKSNQKGVWVINAENVGDN